ncbi:hypothetical protein [Streptomyces sp. NRRL F-5123]|uniref:hypothetical protein n=1 Tax=Streptomyces sp. NRRL F-5123 TaxID=1463856 RepID=UPI000ACA440E|nr:hypothetical protein [Streptomyces sp. NRRL F-5123]
MRTGLAADLERDVFAALSAAERVCQPRELGKAGAPRELGKAGAPRELGKAEFHD